MERNDSKKGTACEHVGHSASASAITLCFGASLHVAEPHFTLSVNPQEEKPSETAGKGSSGKRKEIAREFHPCSYSPVVRMRAEMGRGPGMRSRMVGFARGRSPACIPAL